LCKLDNLAPAWKMFGRTLTSQWINTSAKHLKEGAINSDSKKGLTLLSQHVVCLLTGPAKEGSHKDTKNLPNTLTWVFVFGNFIGGDILLKNTKLRLKATNGCAYGFLADREDHSLDTLTGDRTSVVNFTHKNVLDVPENAKRYNLDPWLIHHIPEQTPKIDYDFRQQLNMDCSKTHLCFNTIRNVP
jgi:hypothetical protein